MKIIVSNPTKQHTNFLLQAFTLNRLDYTFFTMFWAKKTILNRTLKKISTRVKNNFEKKEDSTLDESKIIFNYSLFFLSLVLRILPLITEAKSFIIDRLHDNWVRWKLKKENFDLIIGSEKSSLKSFEYAKANNKIVILDLAQVHVGFIETLRKKHSFFKEITGSDFLFNKIKNIKLQEYELADYILVISQFAKKTLVDGGISEEKIKVINLGCNVERFAAKESYTYVKNLRLVFVGTVTKRKGVHLLTELLLGDPNIKAELVIVGPADDAIDLLSNNQKIRYLPFQNHFQLVETLKSADVFVFPSYLDSWAMVVLEAMACGLPVILTEQTGAAELVSPDCGFVIKADDLEMLKEKILFFESNREKIKEMGLASRKKVENYSWENYYQKIVKLLSEISPNTHESA
ncbi:MAG: glycosyltransferase family 4 protein [Proteobacteria bacterium]|nr:glycosyltransferase family 4 protein [Pseudomonadota bacterium]